MVPYFGYARQDRKTKPRTPISARLVADLLTAAGVHRVLAIDLHAGQIQGFFNIPVDHLYAMPVLMEYLKGRFGPEAVIVSPDAGGVERARAFSKRLDRRPGHHRQAPPHRQRGRGGEHHRRRRRAGTPSSSTT